MNTILATSILFSLTPVIGAPDILETPGFLISIEHLCEEGCVSCNQIRYTGKSKKTKKSITLMGETIHTFEADGVTPNVFKGYRFVKDSTVYIVHADGILIVTQNGKLLIEERGEWKSR